MNLVNTSNVLAMNMCTGNYRYLYGGKGQPYTSALVRSLHALYPGYIDLEEALKDADKGHYAIDCSGFVCKVLGINNMGSYQLRNTAVKRLKVTESNARAGMVLWRAGHVAYVGDNLRIYEAASTKADMRVSSFEDRAGAFTELLVVKGSALAEAPVAEDTNPYSIPTRTIKYFPDNYMSGEDVKWVQFELADAGFDIDIDGEWGPKSDAVLRAFQASCKLEVDGKCGPLTRAALQKDLTCPFAEPTRTIEYIKEDLMEGEDVKWVQWNLVEAGFTLEVDGIFGPKSDRALQSFQGVCGLEIDGKCGPLTRAELKK